MTKRALNTNIALHKADRLEVLKQRINDDNYLNAAIQRLALVMSNELMDITTEGGRNERRKRRK